MKTIINLMTLASYALVCYFTVNFLINAFIKISGFLSGFQFILTSAIILLVTILSGYFCYKIITEKDTM